MKLLQVAPMLEDLNSLLTLPQTIRMFEFFDGSAQYIKVTTKFISNVPTWTKYKQMFLFSKLKTWMEQLEMLNKK
jgi:uncharacterized protein YfbU (UPF0304 family)